MSMKKKLSIFYTIYIARISLLIIRSKGGVYII